VIDPRGVSDTNLGDAAWYKEEFEDEEEESEEGEENSNETADIETHASSVNLKACAAPGSVRSPRNPATRYPVQKSKQAAAHRVPQIRARSLGANLRVQFSPSPVGRALCVTPTCQRSAGATRPIAVPWRRRCRRRFG
jgi:hypothetical protein